MMPCGKEGHRKHTPITSKAQRGMFGAELARRRAGKQPKMKGITSKELSSHLTESAGKTLPNYVKARGERTLPRRKR